jgi:hypothetical protein
MSNLYFTEEHNLFRESLRDFLQKEVVPHIEKWEESGHIERLFGRNLEKWAILV